MRLEAEHDAGGAIPERQLLPHTRNRTAQYAPQQQRRQRQLTASQDTQRLLPYRLDPPHLSQQQQRQAHQQQQFTIVQLSTFKDLGRTLTSLASLRARLAPELLRELLLLCPWQEYLVLRSALAPTLAGRACSAECYLRSAPAGFDNATAPGIATQHQQRQLLVDAADGGVSSGEGDSSRGGAVAVPPSKAAAVLAAAGLLQAPQQGTGEDSCSGCGPPVWVVPEHLALGISREDMAAIPNIYGYRLQMVLKLAVSALASTSHYLVLDSDVLLVRPVSPATAHWLFPAPGRALFQPQRRAAHAAWWNATESLLGLGGCLSASPEARVFGVTPALLATRLAAATVRFWAAKLGGGGDGGGGERGGGEGGGGGRRGGWAAALRVLLPRGAPFFTEYCSYHLVSECVLGLGTLERYHAPRRPGAPRLYRGLWRRRRSGGTAPGDARQPSVSTGSAANDSGSGRGAGGGASGASEPRASGGAEWHEPGGRAEVCDDCLFLVVQSNAGVPEAKVVSDLESLFV